MQYFRSALSHYATWVEESDCPSCRGWMQAHQLINLAEQQGIGGQEALEALFRATYEEGLNVSELAVLEKVRTVYTACSLQQQSSYVN